MTDCFVKLCDASKALARAVVGLAGMAGLACSPAQTPAIRLASDMPMPVLPVRNEARIFVSGHSLTAPPMQGDLVEIARSLHTPAWVNQQVLVGSTLRMRTRGGDGSGQDAPGPAWSGYRQGANREGEGLDVLAELRAPRTIPGRYDTLLVTERHDLGWALMTQDSVPALRHFHERLHEANPQAQTYFYEPWSDLTDAREPAEWIAYEREASPMWQCLASRVNVSLEAEGRAERIRTVPAGAALAELLARALRPEGLPGISRPRPEDTVALLFSDRVHPTRLGSYFTALVSYAVIYRRSPEGAWAPPELSAEQAASLQAVAAGFVEAGQQPTPSLTACRAQWKQRFCTAFWRQWGRRDGEGPLVAMRSYRNARQCQERLSAERPDNPLFFDAKTDQSVWWRAP